MLRVGLTGSIGCGKSTVGQMFRQKGCYVIDADELARIVVEPRKPAWEQIQRVFGSAICREDGSIDREKLGDIIFRDAVRRDELNAIVHPAILQEEQDVLESIQKREENPIVFTDAALLIETGLHERFDALVVVVCSEEQQLERLRISGRFSLADIKRRVRSQMSSEEKGQFADYLIDNAGSIAQTKEQVEDIYQELVVRTGGPRRKKTS